MFFLKKNFIKFFSVFFLNLVNFFFSKNFSELAINILFKELQFH